MMSPNLRKQTGIKHSTDVYYCTKCRKKHRIKGSKLGFKHRCFTRM